MLHRLCGSPSIPLSFSLAAVLLRRRAYRVSLGHWGRLKSPTPSTHRLGRGLPGYLIRFAPHAFVSERQDTPSILPSLLAFYRVSTDFTPTHDIPDASEYLNPAGFKHGRRVKLCDFMPDLMGRLQTLYAQSFRVTLAPPVLPRLLAQD